MLHDILSALLGVSGDFLYCDPSGQFQVICIYYFLVYSSRIEYFNFFKKMLIFTKLHFCILLRLNHHYKYYILLKMHYLWMCARSLPIIIAFHNLSKCIDYLLQSLCFLGIMKPIPPILASTLLL